MDEGFLFEKIREQFPSREYAVLPQVANRTGGSASNYADAVALSLWPSRGLSLYGFEIKCSRQDFKREIEKPEKAEAIAAYCQYWYIVAASEKVAPLEEMPENWGLYVYDEKTGKIRLAKKAPKREDAAPLSIGFIAAVLRRAQEVATPEARLREEHAKGYAEGMKRQKEIAQYELESLREEKKKWAEFSKASGVDLNLAWLGPGRIGEAVKTVLSGDQDRWRRSLIETAQEVLEKLT